MVIDTSGCAILCTRNCAGNFTYIISRHLYQLISDIGHSHVYRWGNWDSERLKKCAYGQTASIEQHLKYYSISWLFFSLNCKDSITTSHRFRCSIPCEFSPCIHKCHCFFACLLAKPFEERNHIFFNFLFFLRFYLFIHERQRKRGRHIGRGRRLHAGSSMWDSILGVQGHALSRR